MYLYSRYRLLSQPRMTPESEPRSLYTEGATPQLEENKESSETLKGYQVAKDSDHEFPEGGRAAWATTFGSFLVQLCGFGYTTSFGVYQDFYTQHYLTNETSSAISWIGSLNAFSITAVGLISGLLYDRGYFYHLVIAGSLLQSFCLFMLSLSKPDQYYQIFLAQGLGLGIASGLMYVPSMAVISHHFRRRRTLVMTFAASGSSLGAIIHPIMLNNLLNGRLGFANGVRASAGLVSVLLLIACLCMRTRLDPPMTPANYIAAARKCVRDAPFIFMTAGGFFFQTGFYYPLFFFQLDSIKHGISVNFSFYSLVILNGSNCVARISSGFIAAFIGVPNLIIVATISCGVLILGMIGLSSLASVVVLGIMYGFFAGLYIAMVAPLMATLTPDLSELGARMGICFFIAGFGSLIGTPISGALLTSNYTWWIPALFSGIASVTGSVMYFIMRFVFVRRQIKEKVYCPT
ncbi:major facilitator superfamily domain-containing protein [Suillus paluster]|uniref:major facilitator superfamily domain-containing protein n=1 Tax=Suillus paluster TaxID=48578 RepID=UPI001B85DACA|nr:major facilitator superfamily domain-containing protein [Suillus paluster]KAG1749131.1 major facilitator superfamily domain-containing protein [Suillus paluster]